MKRAGVSLVSGYLPARPFIQEITDRVNKAGNKSIEQTIRTLALDLKIELIHYCQ